MTFDEAWKQIKELSFPIQVPDEADDAEVWMSDLIDVFEELRQEYAPTILLTKNQYKEIKAGHTLEEKIARIQRLTDNSNDESADSYINDDMIMRSYLHPETIKIVDE